MCTVIMKPLSLHTLISDPLGKLIPLVLIVYKFDGVAEHAVLTRPHGNAKTNKPYRQTIRISIAAQKKLLTKYLQNEEVSYHLKVLVSCQEEEPKPTI